MHRAALLALLLVACTGGPIDDTSGDDTSDTSDTSDTGDTADTSEPDDTDNPDADIGLHDTCGAAEAGPKLTPGNYNGTTDDWDPDLDGSCVAGGGAGPEKLFAIDVPTDHKLIVDFRLQGNDARLYLVENCNISGVCIASANTTGGNASEHVEWTNSSGATETIYVVLDSRDSAESGETWTLAVALQPYTPPTLLDVADACDDLGSVTPISGSGSFAIDMAGLVNDYNAGTNFACTGDYSSGVDAVVPVAVADGATLSIAWGHPSCDTSVYLVETCGDLMTCLAGEDVGYGGSAETFTWQNTTGRDGTFALVLDHYGTSCVPSVAIPGQLDVTIDAPFTPAFDACDDAEAATPVPPGIHYVLLGDAADDLDLADANASCTGHGTPGPDAFVPVSVPAGQELRARFETGSGDAAIYVVEDCADGATCVAGADATDPEELRWINEGAIDRVVYLAIDSQFAPGHDDAPPSGLLTLDVFPPLGDIRLADKCSELDAVPRIGEGTHVIVMDDLVNNIDLGAGNECTGWSSTGTDGMVRVRVRPGYTIDVAYDPGCDGSVYLLESCSDLGSCLDGQDTSLLPETASWTNDTGSTLDVTVVMDAWSGCRPTRALPGELVVDLTPPPSVAAETCAAALALPPVTEGIHPIDVSLAVGDFDTSTLDPAGCGDVAGSAGAEVYVPIEVPAGHAVDLAFDPDRGDPSLYLLADCDTAPVCIDGADAGNPEVLYWLNDTGSDATIVAVIDTAAADASADEPQSGFLEVYFEFPAVPLTAADTCAAPPTVTPGRYEIDLGGFVDDLDLADGAGEPCTDGQVTPGRDGFVAIEVPAGKTLSVEWDASISTGLKNGSVYLLDACDVDACLVGSDGADPEQVDWTNTSAQPATVTIAVDSVSASGGPDKGLLTVSLSP